MSERDDEGEDDGAIIYDDDLNAVRDQHELSPAAQQVADHMRLMRYFAYEHLPPHLQDQSRQFSALAAMLIGRFDPDTHDGPELTVALRKLLEAKDAAVRSIV